jgi:hypothetical protein
MKIEGNYIKINIGLSILLFSFFAESKQLDYKFHWLSMPVAKLSINLNESSSKNNKTDNSLMGFQISTEGPLKLYRNYSSLVKISNRENSWSYELSGQDRGQPEEKLIIYYASDVPEIKIFVDDKGVDPILVDSVLDIGAIDPFTVLTQTIQQLKNERDCEDIFFVMDGKRRYEIELVYINKTYDNSSQIKLKGDIYHCQYRVVNKKIIELNKIKMRWPFNEKNKIIDVWFSEKLDYFPVKFEFQGPFGKIRGYLSQN